MNIIHLVQDDTKPRVLIQLWDNENNIPKNVASTTITVKIRFREQGETEESLFINTLAKVNGGSDGLCRLTFTTDQLDIDEGSYEGQVEITDTSDSSTQTLRRPINFYVHAKFPTT